MGFLDRLRTWWKREPKAVSPHEQAEGPPVMPVAPMGPNAPMPPVGPLNSPAGEPPPDE